MDDKEFNKILKALLQPISEADANNELLTLKEFFELRMRELDLSQNQVEKLLNIERKSLDGILDRTAKRVDIVNVLKLGSFLNLTPEITIQFLEYNFFRHPRAIDNKLSNQLLMYYLNNLHYISAWMECDYENWEGTQILKIKNWVGTNRQN